MTVPISQTIVDAVVELLGEMDPTNGYNLDWKSNGGAQKIRNVNRLIDLPTCIVNDESEDAVGEFSPFQIQHLEIIVQAVIEWPKDDDEFAIYGAIDLARADVYRAILGANQTTPVLGIAGLEKIAPTGHVKAADIEGDAAGAVIRVLAMYRHNSFDPGVYP